MIKKIGITLLCVALGTSLYAREDISLSKPFIGLEIGYATVQGDVGGFFPGDVFRDYEGSDVEFGIRIGAKKDEWRTTLSFNYFDGEEDGKEQNYEKGLASVDYFFLNSNGSKLQPFIGVNVGYINYESTNNIDMSGFIYGAQAGIVVSITDNIDLDLQYRYSLSNATHDDRDASLDHIDSIVFGINYVY
jgi:opacity protein-like surface antigen